MPMAKVDFKWDDANLPSPPVASVISQYAEAMGRKLAADMDRAICTALIMNGVEAPIYPESLRGRLGRRTDKPDLFSTVDLIWLDGRLILEIIHRQPSTAPTDSSIYSIDQQFIFHRPKQVQP